MHPSTLSLNQKHSSPTLNDPSAPSTPLGFRAQLNHFIPKHSYFRARVFIHQIDSVPFVNGHFSVRWKFKHVHSPPSNRPGLLAIVKTRSKNGDKRLPLVKLDQDSLSSLDPSVPSLIISTNSTSTDSSSGTRVPSFSSTSSSISTLQPCTPTQDIHSEPVIHSTPPFSSNGAHASTTTLHLHPPSSNLCTSTTSTPAFPSFAEAPTSSVPLAYNTPARGYTPYLDLKDHSVHWNHTLSTVIRLDVDRDTGYILPCPFKLVVMQRVKSDDSLPNPEVHRLGALYLNLSEYVGHGSVERRYLLRESKTNATLKLTIELDFISGESHYIPPPLPKGEILNGLAGYLKGERYRTRAQPVHHGIDLYGPYRDQEELELDLFGTKCPNKRSWSGQRRFPRDDDDSDVDEDSNLQYPAPAFDVERLPLAYGTKTTETLIEAIFNPVRTTERRCESPFTVYVPPPLLSSSSHAPKAENEEKDGIDPLGLGLVNLPPDTRPECVSPVEVASLYSTESSSGSSGSAAMSHSVHSQYSQNSAESKSLGGGSSRRVKGWWKKVASRPQTPVGQL